MMIRMCFGAATVVSALFFSAPAWTAEPIGSVVAVVGAPSASGPGGDRKLAAGASVFENDKVSVGSGNAQIQLKDGTKLVVGSGSTLVLDRYLMSGGSTARKVSVKALRGTFRFITGRSAKSAYDIKTANATIGIRGTGFDFWVRSQTGVAVMVGIVRLSDQTTSVQLRANCEVGRAGASNAQRLTGKAASAALQQNFPFILNQASLRPGFRLPVNTCRNIVFRGGREGGGSPKVPDPRPPRGQGGLIGTDGPPGNEGNSGNGP